MASAVCLWKLFECKLFWSEERFGKSCVLSVRNHESSSLDLNQPNRRLCLEVPMGFPQPCGDKLKGFPESPSSFLVPFCIEENHLALALASAMSWVGNLGGIHCYHSVVFGNPIFPARIDGSRFGTRSLLSTVVIFILLGRMGSGPAVNTKSKRWGLLNIFYYYNYFKIIYLPRKP